jgi:hypothetical protein
MREAIISEKLELVKSRLVEFGSVGVKCRSEKLESRSRL